MLGWTPRGVGSRDKYPVVPRKVSWRRCNTRFSCFALSFCTKQRLPFWRSFMVPEGRRQDFESNLSKIFRGRTPDSFAAGGYPTMQCTHPSAWPWSCAGSAPIVLRPRPSCPLDSKGYDGLGLSTGFRRLVMVSHCAEARTNYWHRHWRAVNE